ncbi:phage tail tape measure protein [Alicyclobacillus dauci]|uniref:Phage tail tape measure protein n=1 Tax=Alicyclobacillus dauci TaxID=1475485 RepID=A0ABY6Z8Y3_9BACL|nr:phage tail tape measure protein [Alicyclobacillus dauci]WAH38621.1 phage tail tape measure protein [Alicyclobacillus dauci]
MADEEVGSLKVTLGLDSLGFQNGISSVNRQLKIVESEFQLASAKLGAFGSSTDQLGVKASSLTKQIELQQAKVDLLSGALAKSIDEKGADARQTDVLTTKYNKAQTQLQLLQNELERTNVELATAGTGLKEAANQADSSSSIFGRLGSTVKSALVFTGVYGGIYALGSALKGVVATGMDFDAEMSKVQALSGATAQQFQQLKDTAIQLGAASVFSSSQVADGMQNLAAAGFSANQIISAMPGILNAAAASGEDFGSVSQIMISTMSAFGMQASDMGHIADVLAAAANASSISIGDMGQTLQYAAPLAKAAGVSLEALSADIAIMGNAGIKGSDAGTALREALTRLAAPPAAAAKELSALGIATKDAQGKMVPFNTIIAELHDKFQNLGQAQQLQAASAIFGQNAMSGMMTVIQASPAKIDQLTKAFQNSNGEAAKMANEMQDNLKGALTQMQGAFESASIKIEESLSPALTKVVNGVTSLVSTISSKNPGQAFANLFPPSISLGIQEVTSSIKMGMDDIKSAFGDTNIMQQAKQFFASLNIGPAIGQGLDRLGAEIQMIMELFAGNQGSFHSIANALNIPPQVQQTLVNVADTMKQIYQTVGPAFITIFKQISDYIQKNGPEIAAAIQNVNKVISAVFNAVWPIIKVLVISTLETIMDAIKNAVKVIEDVISVFSDLFTGNWSKLWQDIKKLTIDGLSLAWDLFQLWIGGKIVGLFKGLGGTLGGLVKDAMGKVSSGVKDGLEAVLKYLSGRVSMIGSEFKAGLKDIMNLPKQMLTIGKSIVDGLWQGISGMGATLEKNVSSFISEHIPDAVKKLLDIHSPSRVMAEVGKNVGQGLQVGIQQTAAQVEQASQDLAQKVIDGINSKMTPLNQTIAQLQARLQFRTDQGNSSAVSSTIKDEISAYNQQLGQLQNAMKSVNAEIAKMNPKTQADGIAKLRDEYSQLATEWWNDRDAITQLNNQITQTSQQAAQAAANAFKTMSDSEISSINTALQNELSALQQAHQQALSDFDATTSAMDAQYQAQLAALQQQSTTNDRANQQSQWDSQMGDLNHQLTVANLMGDTSTINQVKKQIDDLNQQISQQKQQWAIQDKEQAIQQQEQQYDAERALQRQALDQEWAQREADFQRKMTQEQAHFTALQAALQNAIATGQMTQQQAQAAWLQAVKDTGDQQLRLQIQADQASQDELNKWTQSYLDIGKKYGTNLGQGVVSGLNSMLGAVQAAAAQLANAASSAMGAGRVAVSGAVATIKPPALARGGIFNGPALVGEAGPEAAIPLNDSTMRRLASAITAQMPAVAGGGGSHPINIYLDSQLIATHVWNAATGQLQEAQRKGT